MSIAYDVIRSVTTLSGVKIEFVDIGITGSSPRWHTRVNGEHFASWITQEESERKYEQHVLKHYTALDVMKEVIDAEK